MIVYDWMIRKLHINNYNILTIPSLNHMQKLFYVVCRWL